MKSPARTGLPRRVHIIGICGVATSALAVALHDRGVAVSGSDKGFFPPVSTELAGHGIPFYAGWHPEKMLGHGLPDSVIAGGSGTSPTNPEIIAAKEKKIPVLTLAEALGRFVVKENSIVTAGTWGKTTNSALLSHILRLSGMKPSCFCGGIPLTGRSGEIADSDWSVVEGDEYQAAIWDREAKFFHYRPRYLLLSAVSWDHADLYPSEAEYFKAFEKLLTMIPSGGFVAACADQPGAAKVMRGHRGLAVLYGRAGNASAAYAYENVRQTKHGLDFKISHEGSGWDIRSPMLGLYHSENITGCFALAHELGISGETIAKAVSEFKGIRRRLEKRHDGDVAVFDDIAHSPEKAGPVLDTLRSIYAGKIIAVFEPNIGGRQSRAAEKYADAFAGADIVIIPKLTKLKVSEGQGEPAMGGEEVAAAIGKSHKTVRYIDDDDALVRALAADAKKGDVIAFLGSHGFRGMIEATVERFAR